ncbi:hypothetical protein G9A89_015722 [Geosiphon pyriformis]|nr:hypothetical protein G9A89_015722 [Geosiphon pyriformis]
MSKNKKSKQSSRQFQDFWNWFLNKHSAETYTAYTIYHFDQAYFEDNFEERNNSINQLLYSTIFKQQPPNFEYLNYQIHIWIAKEETIPHYHYLELDDFERAATANQYNEKYKFQIIGGYFQGFFATWFLQETDANAQHRIIRWILTNTREENTFFTTWFETKFRTPILISKWHMELKRRTQGLGEVVTKYAKAIRKIIKYNSTIDMAIELAQKIEDNQRMHLRSTLPVFAPVSAIVLAPQMATASFAVQT